MSQWPSIKARRLLAALFGLGWKLKRQSGSHGYGAAAIAGLRAAGAI